MPTETAPPTRERHVLTDPAFRKLWLAHGISHVGNGLTNFAVLITINRLTGSSAAIATMTIAITVPQLLFGLIAGVYVDRWDRRRTIIVCDLLRGASVLGFVLVRHPGDVWIFYVMGFVESAVSAFSIPAKTALVPAILGKGALLSANSAMQTFAFVARVVGAGLAGVLLGALGVSWPAFVIDVLTFVASALLIAGISSARAVAPRSTGGSVRDIKDQLVEGLRLIFSLRPVAAVMLVLGSTSLCIGAVTVLSIPFLVNILHVRTELLGAVDAAEVGGMFVGSVAVASFARRLRPHHLIVFGMCAVGAMIAAIGAAPSIWLALAATFCAGLGVIPIDGSATTVVQTLVPDEKQGRASSAMNTVLTGASVVSMAAAGILGTSLGIRNVFYLAGALTVMTGLLAGWLMRSAPERER